MTTAIDPASRIECRSPYRAGFIEIGSGAGIVSLEAWEIDGGKVAVGTDIRGPGFPADAVTGDAYLEMTPDAARRLIALLQRALEATESGPPR